MDVKLLRPLGKDYCGSYWYVLLLVVLGRAWHGSTEHDICRICEYTEFKSLQLGLSRPSRLGWRVRHACARPPCWY